MLGHEGRAIQKQEKGKNNRSKSNYRAIEGEGGKIKREKKRKEGQNVRFQEKQSALEINVYPRELKR